MTWSDQDPLNIGSYTFSSRLITGTGKYKDFATTKAATEAAGAEMVTVAVRRVNITDPGKENLLDYLDPKKYVILPNTAGCYTAEDAVRTLRLAREAGGWKLVKLEVLGDTETLYPNVLETVRAAEQLVADGFQVMAYTNDDPIVARRLEEIGCVAVMPLGNPIGSGRGLANPFTHPRDQGAGQGADRRGRRYRHGLGCRPGHGTRCRCRVGQYGDRRGEGPLPDGAGDARCRACRSRRLSRGTHAQARLCQRLVPDRGLFLGLTPAAESPCHKFGGVYIRMSRPKPKSLRANCLGPSQ
jgi:Uncharacterized enzyme of thiazole biosynthesis